MYNYSSDVNMTNCLLTGNQAFQADTTGGAAIHNLGSNLTIRDCTIADNPGNNPATGKAITSYDWTAPADSNIVITNSILYNGGNEILTNHTDTVSISYSDVQGGWSGTGTGNINKNPQFTDPGQRGIEGQWYNGDYTLKNNSPCIDVGKNSKLPLDIPDLDMDDDTTEKLPIDLASEDRVQNTTVDMGAYESTGTTGTPVLLYSRYIPYQKNSSSETYLANIQGYEILPIHNPDFPIILTLEIVSTSAAGGTWTAWFDPDPGVLGLGYYYVTYRFMGDNIDLSQLPVGETNVALLTLYYEPAP
jgi:hypothetical protein